MSKCRSSELAYSAAALLIFFISCLFFRFFYASPRHFERILTPELLNSNQLYAASYIFTFSFPFAGTLVLLFILFGLHNLCSQILKNMVYVETRQCTCRYMFNLDRLCIVLGHFRIDRLINNITFIPRKNDRLFSYRLAQFDKPRFRFLKRVHISNIVYKDGS